MNNRLLFAIHSCVRDVNNGANKAIRETWLKDAGFDHKFFIGGVSANALYFDRPAHLNFQKDFKNFQMKKFNPRYEPINQHMMVGDEVILAAPDEYSHLTFKLKAECNWALERDYEYMFKVDTDTYVNTSLFSKQQLRDYCGVADKGVDYRTGEEVTYAFGGQGFILSRKAMEVLASSHVDILADDAWAGVHLKEHGIVLRPFVEGLTEHLGQGTGQYRWQQMIDRHEGRG